MEDRDEKSKEISDALLIATTSAFLKTSVSPIERVKLLFQLQHVSRFIHPDKQYEGIVKTLIRLSKEQGIMSLWRGNLANILRYAPYQALNSMFKKRYDQIFLANSSPMEQWKYSLATLASGGAAGASSLCLVHPLDYIRTRLSVDVGRTRAEREYLGISDCFRKSLKTDGLRGVYRGFAPSIGGIVVYRAISFGMFDILKETAARTRDIPLTGNFLIARGAIAFAAVTSYPFDTVRRRMMMQVNIDPQYVRYKSTRECWIKIAREEGFRGFFKGCFTNLLSGSGMAILMVINDESKDEIIK